MALAFPVRPIPRGALRTACVLLLGGLIASIAAAQGRGPVTQDVPVVQEIEVPASQPGLWPAGPWHPVPRASFEAFRRSLKRPADAAPNPVPLIESITYEASLVQDALVGTFEAKVLVPEGDLPGTGATGTNLLDLTGTGVALAGLQWGSPAPIPATWGVASDDRLVVFAPSRSAPLTGQWSLRGRMVFDSLECDLVGLPALASTLRLKLPPLWSVESDHPVRAEGASAGEAERTWVLDLGHRPRAKLTLKRSAGEETGPSNSAWESATVLTVTRTGTETTTDLSILGRIPGPRLEFAVPRDLQISSVTYGETPLAFRRERGEKVDRLMVEVNDWPRDARTTLRFRGAQTVRWPAGKSVLLQDVSYPAARALRRRVTLHVDRPLELQSLATAGLEQADVSTEGNRETYVFDATARDARLSIAVSEPKVRLAAELWTLADFRTDSPALWTVWSLESQAGEAYRLNDIPIPEPWEVVRVVPVDDAPDSSLAQWNFERKGNQGFLSIEFRRGLTPQAPKRIVLELRGQPLGGREASLPVLVPDDAREVTAFAAVWAPPQYEVRPAANAPWRKGVTGDLPAEFFQLGGTFSKEMLFDKAVFLLADGQRGPLNLTLVPTAPAGSEPLPAAAPPASPAPPFVPPRPTDPAVPAAGGPDVSVASIVTTLGAPGAMDHLHTAEYRLSGETRLAELQFTLPADVRPVSIQDEHGDVAFAFSEGRLVFGDPQRRSRWIRFDYRTRSSEGWLLTSESISFPQLAGFAGPMLWRVELNGSRALLGTDLPQQSTPQPPLGIRWSQILGPLERSPGEPVFNPFRRGDWRNLVFPEPADDPAAGPDDLLHLLRSVPPRVQIQSYSVPRVRTLAWTLFLGCLLTGAFARRARWYVVRQAGYFSMCLLVPLAWFLPPLYGIPMGAIAAGLTLIHLVPRGIVVRDQFWKPRQLVSRRDPRRVSTVITGAVALFVGHSALTAQDQASDPPQIVGTVLLPTEDGQPLETVYLDTPLHDAWNAWRKRDASPAYVVESAHYSVSDDQGRLSGKAEIAVRVLDPAAAAVVRLPFENVTLDAASGCQVDGRTVQMLPAADGKSILISLPAPSSSAPRAATSGPAFDGSDAEPRRHRLQIDFLPRTEGLDRTRMEVLVPSAGATDFTFRSRSLESDRGPATIRSLGPVRHSESGVWTAALGSSGRLSVVRPLETSVPGSRETTAQTFVEIDDLSLLVQARVDFALGPDGRAQTVEVPAGALVESVTGPLLEHYRVTSGAAAGTQKVEVLLRPASGVGGGAAGGAEHPHVDIMYRLPFDATEPGPALPALVTVPGHSFARHRIGLSNRGTVVLEPIPRTDGTLVPVPVTEFVRNQPDELVWPTPQLCFDQSAPGPIALQAQPSRIPRSVHVRQGLVIDRSQTRWSAQVELQPSRTPLLSHVFRIDPRLTVNLVSAEQDGAERLVRSVRNGDRLTLFVRSQTADPLQIRMDGTWSGDRLNWSPVPMLGILDGETRGSELTIRNESSWILETDLDRPDESVPLPAVDSTRSQVLVDLMAQPEARFRLRPGPDAAQAETWVRLASVSDTEVAVGIHCRVTSQEGPLQVLSGTIPAALAGSVSGPALMLGTPAEDGAVPFTLNLVSSPQSASSADLLFGGVVTVDPSGELVIPEPTFDSARVVRRHLMAPRSFPFVPAAGTATTASGFRRASLPEAWRAGVNLSDVDVYLGRADSWTLEHRVDLAETGTAATPLVEAIVWPRAEETQGITRIVAVADRPATLRITVPDGVQVTGIRRKSSSRPADDLKTAGAGGGPLLLRIDPSDSQEEIELAWTAPSERGTTGIEVPRPQGHENVLLAVIPPRDRLRVDRGAASVSSVVGGLRHLSNLLETVKQQRNRAWSLDDPGLEAIRQCESGLQQAIASGGAGTDADRRRLEELRGEWKAIQQTLPVNAAAPGTTARGVPTADLMTTMVASDARIPVEFYEPLSEPVELGRSLPQLPTRITLVVVTGLSLLFLLRGLDRMQRRVEAADWMAGHAFVAMFGLGVLWWLAFSPSALGLAIIAATGFVKLLHVVAAWQMQQAEMEG